MKTQLLAIILLATTTMSTAIAGTNLPFVGTKSYNFMGGNGTERSITIKQDGTVIVKIHGTVSTGIEYRGKFKNLLQFSKGEEYYRFSENFVEMLDEKKQPIYECGDPKKNELPFLGHGEVRCVQELY